MVVSQYTVKCEAFSSLEEDLDECKLTEAQSPSRTDGSRKTRSKSVHFADSKGMALASIFFFAKEHFSPPTQRKRITYFKDTYNRRDPSNPAKLLNFTSTVPYADVLKCLERQNVCLEKIVCHSFGIYGRIQVKNLAFEKQVFVRYTFDAWQTLEDVYANYIPGASTEESDSFFFQIKPPRCKEKKKMELAVCYRVRNEEFWDNNHGDNFRLIYFKSVDTVDLPVTNDLPDRNI